jgi:hypothetical protein
LQSLFAPDRVLAHPTGPEDLIQGVDAIIAAYARRPRNRLTQHLCMNISVTVESPDTARGSCRILLFTADASGSGVSGKGRKPAASQLIGTDTDRFVRLPEGRHIAERRGGLRFHT